jgi:Mlc titration factor MtfA (ptsG expression regulator)
LLASPLPGDERALLAGLRFYANSPVAERARLEELARVLRAEKPWEPCGGFVMTPSAQLLIAVQAARLLVGMGEIVDPYPDVTSILVYPTAYLAPHQKRDAIGIVSEGFVNAGEAWMNGPVVLTWDAVAREAAHPEAGHTVVLPEFCHRLDMEDGLADGTPSLPSRAAVRAWAGVMTEEFGRHVGATERGERTVLDAYGATNPTEFFSVATECFFERPRALRRDRPGLYALLAAHYRQDPAERFES